MKFNTGLLICAVFICILEVILFTLNLMGVINWTTTQLLKPFFITMGTISIVWIIVILWERFKNE